jgi:hypothetical protein
MNTIDNLIRIDKNDFVAILSEVKEQLKEV